jgi:hypothetical protein
MLAALASVPDMEYQPVHLQKLLFLIDENCADAIGGKKFDFHPGDFGPVDTAVYDAVEEMADEGLLKIKRLKPRFHNYSLTPQGLECGKLVLGKLPTDIAEYITDVVKWMRRSYFDHIVQTVCREYPGMSRGDARRMKAE